jgi:uncharacterized pyridoxal phosphate-containing UPF0001 family protein
VKYSIIGTLQKKKSRELTEQQSQWNYFHAQTRSKIERIFGKIKHKFVILRNTFRGPSKKHSEIIRICCAIYNSDHKSNMELEINYDFY